MDEETLETWVDYPTLARLLRMDVAEVEYLVKSERMAIFKHATWPDRRVQLRSVYQWMLTQPPNRFIHLRYPDSGVYFIQAEPGGPIKIGFATDRDERLAGLQTAHHEELVIRAFIVGGDERELHRRFKELRIRGEWFRDEPPLSDLIAELAPKRPTVERLANHDG